MIEASAEFAQVSDFRNVHDRIAAQNVGEGNGEERRLLSGAYERNVS
jgi:hypothetical protein